jgi:hypothetical protein
MSNREITLEILLKKIKSIERSIKRIENFMDCQNRVGIGDLRWYRESSLKRRPTSRIWRHKKAFDLCVSMLSGGHTYDVIAKALSDIKGFGRISKTSIGTFYTSLMGKNRG